MWSPTRRLGVHFQMMEMAQEDNVTCSQDKWIDGTQDPRCKLAAYVLLRIGFNMSALVRLAILLLCFSRRTFVWAQRLSLYGIPASYMLQQWASVLVVEWAYSPFSQPPAVWMSSFLVTNFILSTASCAAMSTGLPVPKWWDLGVVTHGTMAYGIVTVIVQSYFHSQRAIFYQVSLLFFVTNPSLIGWIHSARLMGYHVFITRSHVCLVQSTLCTTYVPDATSAVLRPCFRSCQRVHIRNWRCGSRPLPGHIRADVAGGQRRTTHAHQNREYTLYVGSFGSSFGAIPALLAPLVTQWAHP